MDEIDMDEIRRLFSDETDDARSMFGNEPQRTSSGDIFHCRAVNIARVRTARLPSVTSASVATGRGPLASPKELAAS